MSDKFLLHVKKVRQSSLSFRIVERHNGQSNFKKFGPHWIEFSLPTKKYLTYSKRILRMYPPPPNSALNGAYMEYDPHLQLSINDVLIQ